MREGEKNEKNTSTNLTSLFVFSMQCAAQKNIEPFPPCESCSSVVEFRLFPLPYQDKKELNKYSEK